MPAEGGARVVRLAFPRLGGAHVDHVTRHTPAARRSRAVERAARSAAAGQRAISRYRAGMPSFVARLRRALGRPGPDRRLVSVKLRGADALCAAALLAHAASRAEGFGARALEETYLRCSGADPDSAFTLRLSAADARVAGQSLLASAAAPLDRTLCAALARVATALLAASEPGPPAC